MAVRTTWPRSTSRRLTIATPFPRWMVGPPEVPSQVQRTVFRRLIPSQNSQYSQNCSLGVNYANYANYAKRG